MGGAQGSSSHMSSPWSESGTPNSLPFLETLDIHNLYKLTKDPIYRNLQWPPIPHKIQRTSLCSMEHKGRIRAPISPPTIFGMFQTLWWMIVSDYIFFPTPSLAMQLDGILSYHAHR